MVNKKQLYEQIMSCVAKEVKKYINENEISMISDLDTDNTDINLSTKIINNKLRLVITIVSICLSFSLSLKSLSFEDKFI